MSRVTARTVAPGLAILAGGAVLARALSELVGVHELLVAIGLGVVLANTLGVPERLEQGLNTHSIWLAAGIVLLGASITLEAILETGAAVLLILLATVLVTLTTVELLARNVAGITDRFGSLLAAGASICGVSAVVAVGTSVRANESQIAYAAGIVLLMDAITLVVYPLVGSYLELPDVVFGVWAGVSMLSTGPVVAVGFAYSEVAGQWATITKLARNVLIGAVVLGYASYYARSDADGSVTIRTLWETFPKFVVGFLVVVGLASFGAFSSSQQAFISSAVDWLFLLAFVGLGTAIRTADLRRLGPAPVLVVLAALAVASVFSLGIALAVL
ncbi:YeiH family protein [Natrialbaceae archaeon A-CW2]